MSERVVSLRMLNQNAGRVVRSVARDGPVKVTDHGRVIAMLVPVPDTLNTWERMVAQGLVEPANPGDRPLPDAIAPDNGRTVAEMIDETRGER